MSNDKPREFWLSMSCSDGKPLFAHESPNVDARMYPGIVHVIEYTAYQKLQAELAETQRIMRQNLDVAVRVTCRDLQAEVTRLSGEVKANESIAEHWKGNMNLARQERDYFEAKLTAAEKVVEAARGISIETTDCGRCMVIHEALAAYDRKGEA